MGICGFKVDLCVQFVMRLKTLAFENCYVQKINTIVMYCGFEFDIWMVGI